MSADFLNFGTNNFDKVNENVTNQSSLKSGSLRNKKWMAAPTVPFL